MPRRCRTVDLAARKGGRAASADAPECIYRPVPGHGL